MRIFPERLVFNTGGSSSGGLFVGAYISAAAAPGANNDFNPGGAPAWPGTLAAPYGRLDITCSAAWNLTGLVAGLDGQLVILRNASAFNGTLNNLNGGSTAANQFTNSFDQFLAPGASQEIVYYAGAVNKWVVVS